MLDSTITLPHAHRSLLQETIYNGITETWESYLKRINANMKSDEWSKERNAWMRQECYQRMN